MKAISGPTYLVQLPSGHIYGYWKKEVLLHDLRINKEDGKVNVFKADENSFVLKYSPIDIEAESLTPNMDKALLERDDAAAEICKKWSKQ